MASIKQITLNAHLRRYLEKELMERVRAAERAYRNAVKAERAENARAAFPSGNRSNTGVSHIAERALERYQQEVVAFTEFLLHQKTPCPQDLLDPVLKMAVEVTGADMGNIQVLDGAEGVLRIKAQRGFKRPFLDFFARVQDGPGSSCGAAMQLAEPVIVEDVRISPIFAGTASLDVLLDAGVQACQSTPVVSPAGQVVGMLSTHYRKPMRPTDRDLELIGQLAAQAAAFLGA